jgi:hypothetical protein
MRVLVCGSRDYNTDAGWNHVMEVLSSIHADTPIDAVIEGGAKGADFLGGLWAQMHKVKRITVPADWATHGKAAGPIRNRRMLTDFKPDLVVAFPGGKGTEDMVRQAEAAGIKVMRASENGTAGTP